MTAGRYEVVGHLATGGMAEVLLARIKGPSGFERPVVLKRILPHLARDPRFEEMFLKEAKLVARIHHPNVVHVTELLKEGSELMLAMEYLEGESLASFLRRLSGKAETASPTLGAHIVAEACAGLHAAHELKESDGTPLGLVHRDVSPQNVFLTYAGGVKLLDFGIAKALGEPSGTEAGQAKGKLPYMSPEQCTASPMDRRSDVFSLGIVLYEIVTGRRLFKRATPLATLEAIVREPIVPPSRLTADIPPELERIVMRALEKSPGDRYATAAEMGRELKLFVQSAGKGQFADELLAKRMEELFADRRAEKEDMLRRVSAGSTLTALPAAETDDLVEIPEIPAEVTATHAATITSTTPTRVQRTSTSRKLLPIAAASVVALTIGALALRKPAPQQVSNALPAAGAASSGAAAAPPPVRVVVTIDSRPTEGEVFVAGESRGRTPLELSFDYSDQPIVVEIKKDGFVTAHETVARDRDQTLKVALAALPAAPTGNSSTTSKPVLQRRKKSGANPAPAKDPVNTKW